MNKFMITFFILLTAIIVSCDGGGGIAGASWDSKKAIAEANNYQSYISPRLSETIIKNQCSGNSKDKWAGISQRFEDIFRSFTYNLERLELSRVELANFKLTASFANHELVVRNNDEIIIKENLPSVFVMHPMRLGIDEVDGTPLIMVVNKSRSSTGRYFVAIYELDGTPLYKNVLIAWQVWDIRREQNYIDILGCGETRRIKRVKA
jgi:hypothetical protein